MERDAIFPTHLLIYVHSSRRAFRFRRVLAVLVISGLVEIKLEGEDGLDLVLAAHCRGFRAARRSSAPGPPLRSPFLVVVFLYLMSTAPSFERDRSIVRTVPRTFPILQESPLLGPRAVNV